MITPLRQIGVMSVNHLRRIALDKALLWLIGMPLVIIYVLGITMHGLFGGEFTPARPFKVVVAATGDAIPVSQRIAEQLSGSPKYFAVEQAAGADQARRAVLNRNADAALLVSERDPGLTIVAHPESVAAQSLAAALRSLELEPRVVPGTAAASEATGPKETPEATAAAAASGPARLAAEASGESEAAGAVPDVPWARVGSFQYFSVAIVVMFLMFASHSAMTYSVEDRTTGAYLRMRAMGISRLTYLSAGVASAALVGVAFALVMSLITWALFRVNWGNPAAWALLTLGGAMSIAALSFLVMALLPENPKSVENAGGTIYTILSFLGGSTAPLNVMPTWFADFFAWLPNRRMLEGYLEIAKGAGVRDLGPELLGLAMTALTLLVLATLALKTFKREAA